MLLGVIFTLWFILVAGMIGLFVYIEWLTYPWQCKICGLPGYPYGCRFHSEPLSDIELVQSMLWPHLPKGVLEYDKWGIGERRIVIKQDGRIIAFAYLREMIFTIYYWDRMKSRFYDPSEHNFVDARQISWNIADPNSTMQIVNKIKELNNAAHHFATPC